MANTNQDDIASSATKPPVTNIEFVQNHLPPLASGIYKITVEQQVKIGAQPKPGYSSSRTFAVLGPRYDLDPATIDSVFPPEGSLGDHYNVLPHIVFRRTTLPWERSPIDGDTDLPWLALLLFDEGEVGEPQTVRLGDLRAPSTADHADWPGLAAEAGEDEDAQVTVIDVKRSLLESLLPDVASLQYVAHVRQGMDGNSKLVGDELSAIIGNRLPKSNARSTVHLVSLDDRYGAQGFKWHNPQANSGRFISLKNWSFTCADPQQRFSTLLLNLDPSSQGTSDNQLGDDPCEEGSSPSQLATLHLSPIENATVDPYLEMGYLPLPHVMREGSKTVSWYHGPLVPWDNAETVELPVRAADQLVRYDPAIGMFDVSYAAAWELGRLLTLQSKRASTSLYAWKRNHAQALLAAEQHVLHLPFPSHSPDLEISDLEKTVDAWFGNLNQLKGVPFNYLVPDERLLPAESIRFFWLDPVWIDCLLDGAFSIGRVTSRNYKDDKMFMDRPASQGYDKVTGLLLRSAVVSGWPGLLVDGYDQDGQLLTFLRPVDRLSPNVLICLFEGEAASVKVHLKPETLHFGFDVQDGNPQPFYKELRDPPDYIENKNRTIDPESVPWVLSDSRVLRFGTPTQGGTGQVGLADLIKEKTGDDPFTSAQFALQMVEGVESVTFRRALDPNPARKL
ncbi:MAG TPA: hypothetical protein VF914_07195 [Chloroflexia bacterium]